MTTGEWVTIIIGVSGVILGAAVFISSIMIKNSESRAKGANDTRDATIEKLKVDVESLEREVTKLRPLEEIVPQQNAIIDKTKSDLSKLKAVVLNHGRQRTKLFRYIESQEAEITKLENKVLSLASTLRSVSELNSITLGEFKRELSVAIRSIVVVQNAVKKIKAEVKKEVDQKASSMAY